MDLTLERKINSRLSQLPQDSLYKQPIFEADEGHAVRGKPEAQEVTVQRVGFAYNIAWYLAGRLEWRNQRRRPKTDLPSGQRLW
jgi:hypothetical protein